MAIHFFTEQIDFKFQAIRVHKKWMKEIVERENKRLGEINVIFTSDEKLLEINQEYLSHDYFTDIITFDNCNYDLVNGELYISVERVIENAKVLKINMLTELRRVLSHGILHLIGYTDKSISDQKIMREKEEMALKLYSSVVSRETKN